MVECPSSGVALRQEACPLHAQAHQSGSVKAVSLAVCCAPSLVARGDVEAELAQHADTLLSPVPWVRRVGQGHVADGAADRLRQDAPAVASGKDRRVARIEPVGGAHAEPPASELHARRQAGVVGVSPLAQEDGEACAAETVWPVVPELRAGPGRNPPRHEQRPYHGQLNGFVSMAAYRRPEAFAAWSIADCGMSPMTTIPSC